MSIGWEIMELTLEQDVFSLLSVSAQANRCATSFYLSVNMSEEPFFY